MNNINNMKNIKKLLIVVFILLLLVSCKKGIENPFAYTAFHSQLNYYTPLSLYERSPSENKFINNTEEKRAVYFVEHKSNQVYTINKANELSDYINSYMELIKEEGKWITDNEMIFKYSKNKLQIKSLTKEDNLDTVCLKNNNNSIEVFQNVNNPSSNYSYLKYLKNTKNEFILLESETLTDNFTYYYYLKEDELITSYIIKNNSINISIGNKDYFHNAVINNELYSNTYFIDDYYYYTAEVNEVLFFETDLYKTEGITSIDILENNLIINTNTHTINNALVEDIDFRVYSSNQGEIIVYPDSSKTVYDILNKYGISLTIDDFKIFNKNELFENVTIGNNLDEISQFINDEYNNLDIIDKIDTLDYSTIHYLDDNNLLNTDIYYEGYEKNINYQPFKKGYSFVEWSIDYIPKTQKNDLFIYATFEVITYYIYLQSEEGTEVIEYNILSEVITLERATHPIYDFLGWYDYEDKLVTEIDPSVCKNIYLRAVWDYECVIEKPYLEDDIENITNPLVMHNGHEMIINSIQLGNGKAFNVLASFSGVVTEIILNPDYGIMVTIKSPSNLEITYYSLSEVNENINVNDYVYAGDFIGVSGECSISYELGIHVGIFLFSNDTYYDIYKSFGLTDPDLIEFNFNNYLK